MGAHACFGASFERLKSSGWYRSTRALQARCLGFETSSLPLSRPRPIQRARSLPALSADARPSCVPSRRAIWFSVTGTAHLIAVSGSHLAIVGFVIESALQKTRLSRGLQRGLLVLALAAYAVFTGASPSAVRACCMVAASLVANGAGRRRHGLSALFVTMAIFVLLRPTVLFEMGFQLSCASVFAILCFCPTPPTPWASWACHRVSPAFCLSRCARSWRHFPLRFPHLRRFRSLPHLQMP